jgi:hypothetical protein
MASLTWMIPKVSKKAEVKIINVMAVLSLNFTYSLCFRRANLGLCFINN